MTSSYRTGTLERRDKPIKPGRGTSRQLSWVVEILIALFALSGSLGIAWAQTDTYDPAQYSLEVQALIETTYLGHARQLPDPGEPAVVLNAYLNQDTHKYLTQDPAVISELDQEIQVWSSLVQAYPDSRHAVEGLAALYMIKGELAQDPIWFRGAANLYIRAAAIGLSWGKIRYTDTLADLFVTLEDKPTLDTVFETILSQPPDPDPDFYYLALVDYANALAELNDDSRAAQFFQQAIAFHPENNIEAITTYTRLLLSRAAANGTAEGATLTHNRPFSF